MFKIPGFCNVFHWSQHDFASYFPCVLQKHWYSLRFSWISLFFASSIWALFFVKFEFRAGFGTTERVFFLQAIWFKIWAVLSARQPFMECSQRRCQHLSVTHLSFTSSFYTNNCIEPHLCLCTEPHVLTESLNHVFMINSCRITTRSQVGSLMSVVWSRQRSIHVQVWSHQRSIHVQVWSRERSIHVQVWSVSA